MKWWFKKPKKLNETTRLYALYGESANVEHLNDKIEELSDRVNNIPQPDLTNLAKLNQANTFTSSNRFNGETNFFNTVNFRGYRVHNPRPPTSSDDIVHKEYVDNQITTVNNRINEVAGRASYFSTIGEYDFYLAGVEHWTNGDVRTFKFRAVGPNFTQPRGKNVLYMVVITVFFTNGNDTYEQSACYYQPILSYQAFPETIRIGFDCCMTVPAKWGTNISAGKCFIQWKEWGPGLKEEINEQ